MDKYVLAVYTIIREQELIIGPTIAFTQARKVPSLVIENANQIEIQGDPKEALANLVDKYSQLFGQASVEVCKEAIKKVTPSFTQEELPDILR